MSSSVYDELCILRFKITSNNISVILIPTLPLNLWNFYLQAINSSMSEVSCRLQHFHFSHDTVQIVGLLLYLLFLSSGKA